ncbi:hypothetical protein OQA88_8061 [Cercophora sp. LCS_1]
MDSTSNIENTKNFCFPIPCLKDSRIKLVPFNISKHAQTVFDFTRQDPHAYAHLSFGPYDAVEGYEKLVKELEEDKSVFTFAIMLRDRHQNPAASPFSDENGLEGTVNIDERKELGEEMVGTMAYCNANPEDRSTEISLVQIFAKYRRRGFAVDAARLLLEYALTPVSAGGLGLARVEWHASTTNLGSIAVAQRLGFEKMGVIRYERFLKDGKERGKVGNGRSEVPPGTGVGDLWRDLVMFVAYWDAWVGGEGNIRTPTAQ